MTAAGGPLGDARAVVVHYVLTGIERVDDGVAALPAQLSNPSARRARECLRFLATHPDSSNREIATGIGVIHQPQISRLLSQLAAENLVSKHSQGAGKRNAWRLEPRGEQVLRVLSERPM